MLKKILLLIGLLLIFGCAQAKDFSYGAKQISSLNAKYNTTIETYPKSISQIDSMIGEYKNLRQVQLESGQEPFNYAISYRILNLEAEKLYIQGQKYGSAGTTKDGFGCKSRPLIIESAGFRNMSALKGFEAVSLLNEFADKYPEEAKSIGLSPKNALFLNATFYPIWRDARSDSSIINHFCPINVTLELYQQEIRKKTNITEDIIQGMSYDEAAKLWKLIRGIN